MAVVVVFSTFPSIEKAAEVARTLVEEQLAACANLSPGVRSIVLDSVAPNELVLGEEVARNLDDALRAQFAHCTQSAACAKAYGDPYATLFQLRDALRAHPQTYALRDPVTFDSPANASKMDGGSWYFTTIFFFSPARWAAMS